MFLNPSIFFLHFYRTVQHVLIPASVPVFQAWKPEATDILIWLHMSVKVSKWRVCLCKIKNSEEKVMPQGRFLHKHSFCCEGSVTKGPEDSNRPLLLWLNAFVKFEEIRPCCCFGAAYMSGEQCLGEGKGFWLSFDIWLLQAFLCVGKPGTCRAKRPRRAMQQGCVSPLICASSEVLKRQFICVS